MMCKFRIFLGITWLILFLSGLFSYEGTTFIYVLFSTVFLVMLYSGVHGQVSYSYLFLVIFLWLGFWFKLTASYFLSGGKAFVFEESIGMFNGSTGAWDEVLWVAMCASMGVMLGRLLYIFLRFKPCYNAARAKAPVWYPAIRTWLWILLLLAMLGVAIFNVLYGIHQIGIIPKTILHWPLNALIAWVLNIGFALAVATLVWWDMAAERGMIIQLCAILAEGFSASVSVISRSMFLFHVLPQLLVFAGRKEMLRRYSMKKVVAFFIAFVMLLLFSIAAVSVVRDYQYTISAPTPELEKNAAALLPADSFKPSQTEGLASAVESTTSLPSSFRFRLIHQLLVNRWIGMEGVMAVSSYPEKNSALFWEMLMEKREAGKISAYQRISNSQYQVADGKHQFASLPGASAFFYYSGSLLVVVLGMAFLVLFVLMVEGGLFSLTQNPLFCSLFGMTVANTIAQFGITPRQDIPYFMMIVLSAFIVCFLQSVTFSKNNKPMHKGVG